MSIDVATATNEIAKLAVAKLNYPPDLDGTKMLAKALARHAQSKSHAVAVIDGWIEAWPQWPKPSDITQLCGTIADPDGTAEKRIAAPDCWWCTGTGWEDIEGVVKSGPFAGQPCSGVARCRCGGMPPAAKSDVAYGSQK